MIVIIIIIINIIKHYINSLRMIAGQFGMVGDALTNIVDGYQTISRILL